MLSTMYVEHMLVMCVWTGLKLFIEKLLQTISLPELINFIDIFLLHIANILLNKFFQDSHKNFFIKVY